MTTFRIVALVACAAAAFAQTPAQTPAQTGSQRLARDLFQQLIEINTTDSSGSTTVAADAMATRLKAAGFPATDIQVLGPRPNKGNLVARFRGGPRKPLLLLAHLDVVEARREDWSLDPFHFLERDGFFYGRGTADDKSMAAIWVANLIRLKQEGFHPDRDIILALTAGEESGVDNGVEWLLTNHRALIDAEVCLNEGGSGQLKNGKRILNAVQPSEKVFQSFRLEVKNPGGHSSRPRKDNAIYALADGLGRLEHYDFPVRLNEVTRTYFERMANVEGGQTGKDMSAVTHSPPDASAVARLSENAYYNALMRTTCVATQLEGGHAENALPQTARAVVNCRILPGESPAEVQRTIVGVLADGKVSVTPMQPAKPSDPSPLSPAIMRPIESITASMWPGVPVVPMMSTGATDSLYLRRAGVAAYGVSGLFEDVDDVRMHGKDERIGVREFFEGQEFLYRLIQALASGK
ncbi:MAG: M20/M25/M40 family metallo-hydrolase [Acidobacteriota bacterium]|nr:M20/M25/M40 family metallo-hydrolase [Acidobacteriota bacterium]